MTSQATPAAPGGAARAGGSTPLSEARLAPPTLRRGLLDRPHVRKGLDAGGAGSLVLVAAPAGYGKTTAVRAWCETADAALAWVTLDRSDNDPVRLWTYIATAVHRAHPGLTDGVLERLSSGRSVESAIDELLNAVATHGRPLVLVLDDLDTLTDHDGLASLDHAIQQLPASMRLVLVAREDPLLQLARRRAEGTLVELRADVLAFTPAEARELLVGHGRLDLGPEEIDELMERTEGWPAALILAWLWLRGVDDPAQAVRAFGGDSRVVADYLTHEVIASLDDDQRSFLFGASVLERFTAALCDGVLDRSDSASMLSALERSNSFVLRLQRGGWYRVHSLFAEYARARLAGEPGAAPRSINARPNG